MTDLSDDTLEAVVELQRVELKRLLREHGRLNDRIDKLIDLQEREQVLRQQTQAALNRLADRADIANAPAGDTVMAPGAGTLRLEARLEAADGRFRTLLGAVADLVRMIEQRRTGKSGGKSNGDHVRVYAPAE